MLQALHTLGQSVLDTSSSTSHPPALKAGAESATRSGCVFTNVEPLLHRSQASGTVHCAQRGSVQGVDPATLRGILAAGSAALAASVAQSRAR